MVTDNVPNIDRSKKEVIGNSICTTKGFNREGPVERVEIGEDFCIVKWSSKFIEIKLFRIL